MLYISHDYTNPWLITDMTAALKVKPVKFEGKGDLSDIENALTGVKHSEEEIRKTLSGFDIGYYFAGASLDNLLEGIIKF